MDRSERRFHKERIKKKAREKARINHAYAKDYIEGLRPYEESYERIAENLKSCKHPACGNVRRNNWEKEKRTRGEIGADMELEEYDND